GRLALALGIAAGPLILYALVNVIANRPTFSPISQAIDRASHHGSIAGEISYIWQLYLPRLPGMANDFPGLFTTHQLWFNNYVGLYGWLDTTFPGWVYAAALIPAAAIVLLASRALFTSRGVLRDRLGELIVYAVMGAGVMVLIGADSYLEFPKV